MLSRLRIAPLTAISQLPWRNSRYLSTSLIDSKLNKIQMDVVIPKFKLEFSPDLKSVLRSVGIVDLFNSDADLSKISGSKELFVSDAFHRTIIEVNEKGTEAAAASDLPKPLPIRKNKSQSTKVKPIIDFRSIKVRGGKGGDGCISLRRLCKNPLGGPDGGDGGSGGHVTFKATNNKTSLEHIPSIIKADDGEKGINRDCHGRNAEHLVLEVPVGTMFKSSNGQILADLNEDGAVFIAARGGAGGKGNHYFATDVNQAPEIAEYGADGEELSYTVEIRTIAHVGLIGLPNAGKSTFLRSISRARPKVAPYPFTTLQPHVGVVKYDDLQQVTVADIPGLIAGAHRNRGLGIAFLRHIERCLCLLYVVDTSLPEPWQQLEVLRYELEQYDPHLLERPSGVLANKMDLPQSTTNLKELRQYVEKINLPLFPVSAMNNVGVLPILHFVRQLYDGSTTKENFDEKEQ
uniref:EOG090X0ACU n=1 Tax=Daphnia pulicaria TaxID=35523 RepID=A0A4Y7MYF3_9CRUS|nr:EOG090X0ACU [Daphnia pulicaria]